LLNIAAVVEGILKVAALITSSVGQQARFEVRGGCGASVVAVVSSAGVVPISDFVFGRRPPGSQPD
jgi:hypothetical protein